ncbi:unnamed protein product [Penicillium salamii]|nr:unnamed protein product [Penicillium salamii]CAG8233835.1 unnamed protein product [Penicillium salamii]
MGRTFQKIHCAMVGRFKEGIKEKIPQWIRANGGQFSRDINPMVTHLIATEEAYKDNVSLVKDAKQSGKAKIVSYDWLEDSLQAAGRRPKRESPYLLQNLTKPTKTRVEAKKLGSNRVTKKEKGDPFVAPTGKKKGNRLLREFFVRRQLMANTRCNVVAVRRAFHDKDGTVYNVTMFRASKPPSKSREKYQLTVFETITEPHSYSTYTKFSRTGKSTVEILTKAKANLESAVARFEDFFKEKTGKEWKDRGDGKEPPPKVGTEGESLSVHEGWFYIEKPKSILAEFIRTAPVEGAAAANDPLG